jgi:hypothetical protein
MVVTFLAKRLGIRYGHGTKTCDGNPDASRHGNGTSS